MNIIDVTKKCVGCGACVDICPINALKLEKNTYGFYEPKINIDVCINCEKCLKACPAIDYKAEETEADYYYGYNKDEKVRADSSSGGAFSAFADMIIAAGGVVFGANYSDDFKSVVMSSTKECSLDELRRSKYCQAYSNEMYSKVDKYLKTRKKVMVTGTPCQIASARRIFKNHDNLLLVDFLCGGVTPSTALSNYIEFLEKKYKSRVKSVNMRDKKRGWNKVGIRVEFENGKTYSSRYQLDWYFHYVYSHYMKNDACLTCLYTKHSDADITIADFWGYKKAGVKNDDKGLSFVAAYTDKGKSAIEDVKENFIFCELESRFIGYAYKDKNYSKEKILDNKKFIESIRDISFMKTSKNHNFKYGKIGVFIKLLIRKVIG